jgi:hypothetical protein
MRRQPGVTFGLKRWLDPHAPIAPHPPTAYGAQRHSMIHLERAPPVQPGAAPPDRTLLRAVHPLIACGAQRLSMSLASHAPGTAFSEEASDAPDPPRNGAPEMKTRSQARIPAYHAPSEKARA